MAGFESSITNKKINSPQLREYDVPDESGFAENSELEEIEIEREIRQAKLARATGKERLNEGARKRIEMLIGLTRTTHSVDINGTVFEFQTLKAKEMREAIMAAAAFDRTVQSPFEIRKQFLARSITHIAGVEVSQFVGDKSLEAKLIFIEEMDDALLNRLYNEYLLMTKAAKNKYDIKTDMEAKELVQDLKK